MKAVFRVDASNVIGIGHVMRCLTLADQLRLANVNIHFICKKHHGNLHDKIQKRGYKCTLLDLKSEDDLIENNDSSHASWLGSSWEYDAQQTISVINKDEIDLLIVDHYEIDYRWHKKLRCKSKKIMVIDDLANRKYDCDYLLDQTYGRVEEGYNLLINDDCELLIGSSYALVSPEFERLRLKAIEKRKRGISIERILISMGGSDLNNIAAQLIAAIAIIEWKKKPIIDVVVGVNSPHTNNIVDLVNSLSLQVNVIQNTNNMAELMVNADLAFGAGGATAWERCVLGLPTIVVCLAKNQADIISNLEKKGVHIILNCINKNTNIKTISEDIKKILCQQEKIESMSVNSFHICDGLGVRKVGSRLLRSDSEKDLILVDAKINDIDVIYDWQCHPNTRKYANNQKIPTREEHFKWMQDKLNCCESFFWIIHYKKVASGVIRLEPMEEVGREGYLISIYISPDKYRLGIAKDALEIVKRIFSDTLIFAKVLENNTASICLFTKAGFIYNDQSEYFEWGFKNE